MPPCRSSDSSPFPSSPPLIFVPLAPFHSFLPSARYHFPADAPRVLGPRTGNENWMDASRHSSRRDLSKKSTRGTDRGRRRRRHCPRLLLGGGEGGLSGVWLSPDSGYQQMTGWRMRTDGGREGRPLHCLAWDQKRTTTGMNQRFPKTLEFALHGSRER